MVTLAVSQGVCVSIAVTACAGMAVGCFHGDARFVGGSADVALEVAASTWAMQIVMVRSVQPLVAAAHFVIPEKLRLSTTKYFSVPVQDQFNYPVSRAGTEHQRRKPGL